MADMHNTISHVAYTSAEQHVTAELLARQLGLPCQLFTNAGDHLILNVTDSYLEIRDLKKDMGIHIDFIAGALAHRRDYGGGKNQPLARAVGMKPGYTPRVLDATAGLAKDAFVLASLGCPLTLIERSPYVAVLIQNAIERAATDNTFAPIIQNGFVLINANAIHYLKQITDSNQPDTIYLDPMYPDKQKSALVKKNMQILQDLLESDNDSELLLDAARKCAKKRIVVKRPKGAEFVGNIKPAFDIASKNTRYDVYLPF